MKKLFSLLTAFVMTVSLVGCGISPIDNANPTKIVKIGVILSLSGPGAVYGADGTFIYQQAVNAFNDSHTGVQVQLIFEDGKSSGRDATSAAEKLIHIDKVDLLFGGNYSSEVLASAMISQPFQIVNLSAVAESPEINNVGEYVYKWLDSSFETTALSRYLLHQQVEKIGIIYEESDYALGYMRALENSYSGTIIFTAKFANTEKDFDMLVKGITSQLGEVEKLLLIPQTSERFIDIRRSLDKNASELLSGENIIVSAGGRTEDLLQRIPRLMEGLTFFFLPSTEQWGDKVMQYMNSLKQVYTVKTTDTYALLFRESIDLILNAIEAGHYDSSSIQQYLRSFSAENPIHGFWEYYFEESTAVGLQLLPRHISNGTLLAVEE